MRAEIKGHILDIKIYLMAVDDNLEWQSPSPPPQTKDVDELRGGPQGHSHFQKFSSVGHVVICKSGYCFFVLTV